MSVCKSCTCRTLTECFNLSQESVYQDWSYTSSTDASIQSIHNGRYTSVVRTLFGVYHSTGSVIDATDIQTTCWSTHSLNTYRYYLLSSCNHQRSLSQLSCMCASCLACGSLDIFCTHTFTFVCV